MKPNTLKTSPNAAKANSQATRFKKRERTHNWAIEEKLCLLNLCKKDISIIENKGLDADLTARKKQVWKKIHEEFMKVFGNERSIVRLKEQWRRMKATTKQEMYDYFDRIKLYGQEVADEKKPNEFTMEVWSFVHSPSKTNGGLDETEDDWRKIASNMCDVEMKYETSDTEDSPNSSKKNCSSDSAEFVDSVVLEGDNAEAPPTNDFAAAYNALRNIKYQRDNMAPMTTDNDPSYDYAFTQLFKMQADEHSVRMEILKTQLETAKCNRDIAEMKRNKLMKIESEQIDATQSDTT